MKTTITLIAFFVLINVFGQNKYEKDFQEFWEIIDNNHAYLKKQNIDWNKVKELYLPKSKSIKNRYEFVSLLEEVIRELHNGHVSLNTNYKTSYKLVPSSSDIIVEKSGNDFFIKDIKDGSQAEWSGLKTGMQVIKINGVSINKALKTLLPKYTSTYSEKMYDYALSLILTGTHDKEREITIIEKGVEKNYYPDSYSQKYNNSKLLDFKILPNNIGYIKINNSLNNKNLITLFDNCLDNLIKTNTLIIDLTDTPSGGNTLVAKAILGRFISEEMPYQKHQFDEKGFDIKRTWIEFVQPRKQHYKAKVFVLVGHWTGSMGEGLAIGFDAIKRGKIVGTKMAGLIGAIEKFELSESKISFQIPTERLYHINGAPREDFTPKYKTENSIETKNKMNQLININQ